MSYSIRQLAGHEFALLAPTLVDIYIAAMGYSPAIRRQRIDVWRGEITYPGFTAVIAIDESAEPERVVGVAYGFTGARGRWWDQQLIRGLKQAGALTSQASAMLDDYFEVAEVHVEAAHQGRGLGSRLVCELVRDVPSAWALLSTPEVPQERNAAFGLYRKLGFVDVVRNLMYAGDSRPFAVLGRRLPLRPAG
ncbi:GNAT family N-acetyltransferase [Corynebacterium timonense]|nr:GNAT family N-acetyltransferase [Corynebacterium timonense]